MARHETPIGERIRELRNGLLTQQDLATAADVSVDLVRKLEQGQRHTASVASLHRIARALDVALSDLLGHAQFPEQAPSEGVTALRYAVAGVGDLTGQDPGEALALPDAERELMYLWGTYWAGHYETLTALLPPVLDSLRATEAEAPATEKPAAAEALARGFWVAGCALIHLRQLDAAFIAIRQAVDAADHGNDPLLGATLRGSMAWQLLVSGRFADSETLAIRAAEGIEPHGSVPLPALSAYGSLVVTAATAAARDGKGNRAHSLLSESTDIAQRMGTDRNDYNTPFGPSQVTMQSVDVGVQTGEYGQALEAAKTMPNGAAALPLAARARHLTDRALANTKLGHHEQATTLVLTAEQMAPDWAKHQALLKSVTRDLLRGSRTYTPQLRELAGRLSLR